MQNLNEDKIRQNVRKSYADVVIAETDGCGCSESSCCPIGSGQSAGEVSVKLGYSDSDVSGVPEGANMGLGCGNPQTIAALKPGETVLDLGSGGGFDCFLAARAVGESGHVIGVDMTPEMITKSRKNAVDRGYGNVEFRLGEIEHIPVADNTVDVIMSNCVINLSPAKQDVYNESFRVLNSGGRLAISDVVAFRELPTEFKDNMAMYSSCISGSSLISEVESGLAEAGFTEICVTSKDESKEIISDWGTDQPSGSRFEDYVISANIEAVKP